ncbi:hypothetical protein AKJ16_DCAP00221 [Drosera capensis]
MTARLNPTYVVLAFMMISTTIVIADFIPSVYRQGFYYGCQFYIQNGIECSLSSTCCPMLQNIANKVNSTNTQDEQSYACLSMKAALYDMPNYSYNKTRDMVQACGLTLPFALSRGASCYPSSG